ncbi:MAG: CHASE3 domain-containing protein, partial [Phycisphaerales bacterium]|nr:CHASE3 domain-containing protein [Phycisphaerales bacterium]
MGVVASVVLAAAVAALALLVLTQTREANERARLGARANRQLERTLNVVTQAEAGERGYLLTGRPELLAPFTTAHEKLDDEAAALRTYALTDADSAELEVDLNRFVSLAKDRLRQLGRVVERAQAGDREGATALVADREALWTMEQLRQESERLRALVTERWNGRLAAVDTMGRTMAAAIMGGVGVIALSVALMGRRLQKTAEEHERAESALRDTEARQRTTLASIADGLIATDAQERVVFMNRVAEDLTGVRALTATGRPVTEVFAARDEATGRPAPSPARGVLAGPGQASPLLAVIGPPGAPRHVEYSASAITNGSGATVGAVLVFRDVVERLRVERERESLLAGERSARSDAERASRLKDEFVATLSHELRTPLNAILGWTQILRRPGVDTAMVSQGLEIIERNARVQTALVSDLLDMSRMMSGKLRLEVQSVNMEAVVRDALETVRTAADAKGVRLTLVADCAGCVVSGDPARLQQVVWNLVSNAIKFTARGGRVTVTLRRVGSQAEVEVVDTGEGVSAQFLPYVFERFRQADATTTRQHGGLGLGLSIARQLTELHGGRIEAFSEGKGKGARFLVSLPIAAVTAHRPPEPGRDGHGPAPAGGGVDHGSVSLDGLDVLLVDDDKDTRALVQL